MTYIKPSSDETKIAILGSQIPRFLPHFRILGFSDPQWRLVTVRPTLGPRTVDDKTSVVLRVAAADDLFTTHHRHC